MMSAYIGGIFMNKIKITAELTPAEEGGYVVYCPELDITTEGETVEEAIYMLKDAASGYVEVVGIENIPLNHPHSCSLQ